MLDSSWRQSNPQSPRRSPFLLSGSALSHVAVKIRQVQRGPLRGPGLRLCPMAEDGRQLWKRGRRRPSIFPRIPCAEAEACRSALLPRTLCILLLAWLSGELPLQQRIFGSCDDQLPLKPSLNHSSLKSFLANSMSTLQSTQLLPSDSGPALSLDPVQLIFVPLVCQISICAEITEAICHVLAGSAVSSAKLCRRPRLHPWHGRKAADRAPRS